MYYVYILQSLNNTTQTYIGSTADLKKRLESHNSGANKYTSKFKPWKIVWYCSFVSEQKAISFEKYLKRSSGIAFRRKRLL
ncbi:MAG: GIY-YIG nuclease family protein [bacterium]